MDYKLYKKIIIPDLSTLKFISIAKKTFDYSCILQACNEYITCKNGKIIGDKINKNQYLGLFISDDGDMIREAYYE